MALRPNPDMGPETGLSQGKVSSDSWAQWLPGPLSEDAIEQRPTAPRPAEPLHFDLASDEPLPQIFDAEIVASPARSSTPDELAAGQLWLEGDVLMCACPDCRAPMSVRIWLMIADCWRCGTSIELSEEQQREAERLLQERARRRQAAAAPASQSNPATTPVTRPTRPDTTARPTPREVHRQQVGAEGRRPLETPAPPPTAQRPRTAPRVRPRLRRRGGWLNQMPAWLISLVFHLILLTILGLLQFDEDEGPGITLSTVVSKQIREGGQLIQPNTEEDAKFDLPIPADVDLNRNADRKAMEQADQDARELRVVDDAELPDIDVVKRQIGDSSSPQAALAARDPRLRVEVVRREGGSTLTEAAVARGLSWLARHQNSDGSWSLDGFSDRAGCNCGGHGSVDSDAAGTALALLPFLGAGQTHLAGIYRDEVAKGLRWMLDHQEDNGDLRGGDGKLPGMYAHGQAAIVLCEAFLMTGDEAFRVPAQKAIDFIVDAQYPDGGWRYLPYRELRGQPARSDTSVVGWQLMALQSGRAANLTVPAEVLENASHFLDSVQAEAGAVYSYMPNDRPTAAMTAEALLCRVYLGWNRSHPGLVEGTNMLLDQYPPSSRNTNIYYWYYATQTMHHYGGSNWDQWNSKMQEVLIGSQETRGHRAGSWDPEGPLTDPGGRVYMTALAVCCLEVYYRHLPIFRQLKLE